MIVPNLFQQLLDSSLTDPTAVNEEFTPVMSGIPYPVPDMGTRAGRAETEFVNLTEHPIVLVDVDGNQLQLPPSGQVAQMPMQREDNGFINKVRIFKHIPGDIANLPDAQKGKIFIVSEIVAQAAKRHDVLAPMHEEGSAIVKGLVAY